MTAAAAEAAELLQALRRRSVVVISPHPDDAALSIGGLLRLVPFSQLVVLTVFTGSRWAPLSDGQADIDQVSTTRSDEDQRYATAIGADRRDGGLPDSSARSLPDAAWMQLPAPDDPLHRAVGAVVADALRRTRPGYLLCPAALGGHVDHVLARDAALSVVDELVCPVLYEDIPYAAELSGEEIAANVRGVAAEARAVVIDISDVFAAKLAGIEMYASQIRPLELAATVHHARQTAGSTSGAAERLWITNGDPGARHA